MTSPAAVIGLTFDGLDLQRADLDILFRITEGLDTLPEARGSEQVIPYRHGRLAEPRMADQRPIVAVGWVTRQGTAPRSAYRAYLDDLKERLDPTRSARLLELVLEDGSRRWTYAMARNLIGGDGLFGGDGLGSDFRSFSIEWAASDPFWYGAVGDSTMDSGLVMDDGEVLDQGAEVVVNPTTTSEVLTLDSVGSASVERIRVRLTGPSQTGVGVEVVTADGPVGFVVATALVAGEEVVVDAAARTAVIGTASIRRRMALSSGNRHGEYLRLEPGQNTVRVLGKPAEARILFTPTWL